MKKVDRAQGRAAGDVALRGKAARVWATRKRGALLLSLLLVVAATGVFVWMYSRLGFDGGLSFRMATVIVITVIALLQAEGPHTRTLRALAVIFAFLNVGTDVLDQQEGAKLGQQLGQLQSQNESLQQSVVNLTGANEQLRKEISELRTASTAVRADTAALTRLSKAPRVTLLVDTPLDQKQPLRVPFVIVNDSNVPLLHVRFNCAIESMETASGAVFEQVMIPFKEAPVSRIEPGEQLTRFCDPEGVVDGVFPGVSRGGLKKADISLLLNFRTPSGDHERNFRLVMVPGTPPRWVVQPWAK